MVERSRNHRFFFFYAQLPVVSAPLNHRKLSGAETGLVKGILTIDYRRLSGAETGLVRRYTYDRLPEVERSRNRVGEKVYLRSIIGG
jgi:hypothetical protein